VAPPRGFIHIVDLPRGVVSPNQSNRAHDQIQVALQVRSGQFFDAGGEHSIEALALLA
jgi:hypothetical protein